MRARSGTLGTALAIATAIAGCGTLEDLGGLRFDLGVDGGGGATAGGPGGAGGAAPLQDGGDPDAAPCPADDDVCAAAPPPGWKGPVAFFEGAPGTVPACSGAYPIELANGHAGLDAPPATCTLCACSTPTPSCGPATLSCSDKLGCHGNGATQMLASGTCTPLAAGSWAYFEQTSAQATASACIPSGGAASLVAPTWSTAGVVCGRSSGATACADGGACAPQPAAPFEAAWCIYQEGAQACPSGFSQKHLWESPGADGRGCTPCACGGASGATCSTSTTLYSDSGCQAQVGTLATDNVCDAVSGALAAIATITLSGKPSCPASGGTPTGSITTTPSLTVCCPG